MNLTVTIIQEDHEFNFLDEKPKIILNSEV